MADFFHSGRFSLLAMSHLENHLADLSDAKVNLSSAERYY
jgi:hypothetical protein